MKYEITDEKMLYNHIYGDSNIYGDANVNGLKISNGDVT